MNIFARGFGADTMGALGFDQPKADKKALEWWCNRRISPTIRGICSPIKLTILGFLAIFMGIYRWDR